MIVTTRRDSNASGSSANSAAGACENVPPTRSSASTPDCETRGSDGSMLMVCASGTAVVIE